MDRRLYPSGKFARKASVSVRTLRYYDQEGLLSPSGYSEAGYRLYSDEDLVNLQQILALKFLGFSLDEIKALMKKGPRSLPDLLAQQKAMMREKRTQVDNIIQAIEEAEKLLRTQQADWNSLVNVIQVIQMEQNKEWVKKYFTEDQMAQMQELGKEAYSDEARAKMAQWPEWTEEDQKRVDAQWGEVWDDIRALTAQGADPAGQEAGVVLGKYNALISAFTKGDPDISSGLNKLWETNNALPAEQQPFQTPLNADEQAYFDRMLKAQNK